MAGNQEPPQVGISNLEWRIFCERLDDNVHIAFADVFHQSTLYWANLIGDIKRRYMWHAQAFCSGRAVKLPNGYFDKIDKDYLLLIENEGPVLEPFRRDFRNWIIDNCNGFNDFNEVMIKRKTRSDVLESCCERVLIKMLPYECNYILPERPLTRLKNHPFGGYTMTNQVTIEEVQPPPFEPFNPDSYRSNN